MTALLCIDTFTLHVRRYETRRPGGSVRMTDEGALVMRSPTLLEGVEAFRLTGITGAHSADEPEPQAA